MSKHRKDTKRFIEATARADVVAMVRQQAAAAPRREDIYTCSVAYSWIDRRSIDWHLPCQRPLERCECENRLGGL